MLRRILREVTFLVVATVAVCAFSATALVLVWAILLWLVPSGVVFD